jgi:cell filamentation protein
MVSKYHSQASEIYYPGTAVPKNKLGIESAELLHAIEENLLREAYLTFIQGLGPRSRFDETLFKTLHRQTFNTLYEWAGVYRSVDMEKGGSKFCRAAYLEKESAKLFAALTEEFALLNGLDDDIQQFAERLAYHQCEVIALHPFYELNGRITRLFFDLIAVAKGFYPIDYRSALLGAASHGNAYLAASIECVRSGTCDQLSQIIRQGLHRRTMDYPV